MGTPLQNVYDSFLEKVTDYDFIRLNEEDELEDVLKGYLRSARVRFSICIKDLSFNEDETEFVSDLEYEEIEILSLFMILQYISSQITHERNMKNII